MFVYLTVSDLFKQSGLKTGFANLMYYLKICVLLYFIIIKRNYCELRAELKPQTDTNVPNQFPFSVKIKFLRSHHSPPSLLLPSPLLLCAKGN